MDKQLISVIVTAFNIEKYLDRCLESIVTQTYPHLEIILVDDGSTDRTGSICDDWAGKDNRIIVIHKKNGGLSDARNTGVRQARGKWLGFVDGDDYISATMFECLYQHRTEKGITVCGFLIEKNGQLLQCPGINKTVQPLEAVDMYITNELQARYYGVFTYWGSYSCNKLFDHCLFDNISYPVGKRFEDACVILDLVQKSEFITFISDCEYIYVQHSNSITHDISNVVTELLYARLYQKEQLSKYWNMTDSRMDKLISVEYYEILYRYACLTPKERENCRGTAAEAWKILQERGYDYFPVKLKIKLFMCVFCPDLFYLLRKIKLRIKR